MTNFTPISMKSRQWIGKQMSTFENILLGCPVESPVFVQSCKQCHIEDSMFGQKVYFNTLWFAYEMVHKCSIFDNHVSSDAHHKYVLSLCHPQLITLSNWIHGNNWLFIHKFFSWMYLYLLSLSISLIYSLIFTCEAEWLNLLTKKLSVMKNSQ